MPGSACLGCSDSAHNRTALRTAGTARPSLRRLTARRRAPVRRRSWCMSAWRPGRRCGGLAAEGACMEPFLPPPMQGGLASMGVVQAERVQRASGVPCSTGLTCCLLLLRRWRSSWRHRRAARLLGWPRQSSWSGSASGGWGFSLHTAHWDAPLPVLPYVGKGTG